MFRNLVTNKNNIISYILSLLISCGSSIFGANPFMMSFYGAQIENKIPVLISFMIMLAVSFIKYGALGFLRFLLPAILFALFTSLVKNKDSNLAKCIKLLLSCVISEIFLLLIGLNSFDMIPFIIFNLILTLTFFVIFNFSLQFILDVEKRNSYRNFICFGLLIVVILSFLKDINVLDINLYFALSIIILMLMSWKKPVLPSLLVTISILCINCLFIPITIRTVASFLITGTSASLLSLAGKKGAAVGLVFAVIYSIIFFVNQEAIYNEYGVNKRIMQEYAEFLENNNAVRVESGENFDKEFSEIEKEGFLNEVRDLTKPTEAAILFRVLIIGFLIILLIPKKLYAFLEQSYSSKNRERKIREILFPKTKVYRLEEGKKENK